MHIINSEWLVTHKEPWATLFRHALRAGLTSVVDPETPELGQQTGIAVFDDMAPGQQVYMLLTAGRVLLEGGKLPQLIQADGTLAALFVYLRRSLCNELELDEVECTSVRTAIFDASRSIVPTESTGQADPDTVQAEAPTPAIKATSKDQAQWLDLLTQLEARVVRHRHFELYKELAAQSFASRDEMLSERRLPFDYYDWHPANLFEQDFEEAADELAWLIDDEPRDDDFTLEIVPPC